MKELKSLHDKVEQKELKIENIKRNLSILKDRSGQSRKQLQEKLVKTENEIKKLKEAINFIIDSIEMDRNK